MPGMTEVARLEGVSAGYGRRQILKDISLSLHEGEFWGLIGPNGAGKSTLLGLFNALTAAQTGTVFFKGRPVCGAYIGEVRKSVAHVFQMIDVDSRIPVTVFKTVLAGSYSKLGLFRSAGGKEKTIAMNALAAVGLAHLAERPLGMLSGGERQRVAIARALAQEPELMLLDEPTAALDWQAQREILALIRELQEKKHFTVLMVSHDLNAVSRVTSHTAILKEGRLLFQGRTQEAMHAGLLSELYGVPVDVIDHAGCKVALF